MGEGEGEGGWGGHMQEEVMWLYKVRKPREEDFGYNTTVAIKTTTTASSCVSRLPKLYTIIHLYIYIYIAVGKAMSDEFHQSEPLLSLLL